MNLNNFFNPLTTPKHHDQVFVKITCKCKFEPFGRASETWELVWTLELTGIPHHWKSTKGWVEGTASVYVRFTGKTVEDVIAQAVEFLRDTDAVNKFLHV